MNLNKKEKIIRAGESILDIMFDLDRKTAEIAAVFTAIYFAAIIFFGWIPGLGVIPMIALCILFAVTYKKSEYKHGGKSFALFILFMINVIIFFGQNVMHFRGTTIETISNILLAAAAVILVTAMSDYSCVTDEEIRYEIMMEEKKKMKSV